ncbi:type 1 glutamine amidotransferase [Persephonella sp.]
MRLHYIQHVHFESPAGISRWAENKGFSIKGTRLYSGDLFPELESFDLLIVLGGPMGVYDEDKYPWLKEEKKFIERCIKSGKKILGICLGAQLIADVLGSRVYKNRHKEIGWFDIQLTPDGKKSKYFSDFPDRFIAFHWHGDTFDIPDGAVHTAKSEACDNQAFVYEDRVVGLQFHLETDLQTAKGLIENSAEDLKEKGEYVQSPEYILSQTENYKNLERFLDRFMEKFEG